MHRFTALLVSVLAFGALAVAQMEPKPFVAPKTEFFLGYAYQRADTSGINAHTNGLVNVDSTSLNGFVFEFSHYFQSRLGFTVDIARGSNKSVDSTGIKYVRTSYMGGPSYRLHDIGFFTPSLHVLGGVDHDDFTVPQVSTVFDFRNNEVAAAAGGAIDANLSRHLAVRLAQVDYLYTHHYGVNQSSFRYSGGVVARF